MSLITAIVAIISLKKQFNIDTDILLSLIQVISILLYVIGISSIIQIFFCLWRWYQFRKKENLLVGNKHSFEYLASLFEGLYIITILVSLFFIKYGNIRYNEILKQIK